MHLRMKLATGAAIWILAAATAVAQTPPVQPQNQQPPAQSPPAQSERQQCLTELQTLSNQMHLDGYWLSGWGARWGARSGETAATGPDATTGRAEPGLQPSGRGVAAGPWGAEDRFGINSPRYQIRVLHGAANVLAQRDDQQACSQVVAQLKDVYAGYVGELRQAGVEPGQVTTWRQERILAAQPVKDMHGFISVDDVTGTEVRNMQDERLGSIHDVVMDPQSGQISHAVVARGGFFGIGTDYVAVPWQAVRVTPDLNLFVLNVQESVMDQAPTVDRNQIGDPSVFQHQRQEADQYWREHTPG